MLKEKEFKEKVRTHIKVGTDVNNEKTKKNNYRIVKDISDDFIIIPKGEDDKLSISWEILYKCYKSLFSDEGYSKDALSKINKKHANCSVTTIGQVLVVCRLATHFREGNKNIYKAV